MAHKPSGLSFCEGGWIIDAGFIGATASSLDKSPKSSSFRRLLLGPSSGSGGGLYCIPCFSTLCLNPDILEKVAPGVVWNMGYCTFMFL